MYFALLDMFVHQISQWCSQDIADAWSQHQQTTLYEILHEVQKHLVESGTCFLSIQWAYETCNSVDIHRHCTIWFQDHLAPDLRLTTILSATIIYTRTYTSWARPLVARARAPVCPSVPQCAPVCPSLATPMRSASEHTGIKFQLLSDQWVQTHLFHISLVVW